MVFDPTDIRSPPGVYHPLPPLEAPRQRIGILRNAPPLPTPLREARLSAPLSQKVVVPRRPKRRFEASAVPPLSPLKRGKDSGSETEADEPQLVLSGPVPLLEAPDDLPIASLALPRPSRDPLDERQLSDEDQRTIELFRSLIRSRQYRAAEDVLKWAGNDWKRSLIQREFVRYYVQEKNFNRAWEYAEDVPVGEIKDSCEYLIRNG